MATFKKLITKYQTVDRGGAWSDRGKDRGTYFADMLNRVQNNIEQTVNETETEIVDVKKELSQAKDLISVLYSLLGFGPDNSIKEAVEGDYSIVANELVYKSANGKERVVTRDLSFLTAGLDRLSDNIRSLENRVIALERNK